MKLKYIKEYRDSTGKLRRYFRIKGQRDVTLPGDPDSGEFMEAYAKAWEASRPERLPERLRFAHETVGNGNEWRHFQITRDAPGARWRRTNGDENRE